MMKISPKAAIEIFRNEAGNIKTLSIDCGWKEKIEELSSLCKGKGSLTHLAFLGTAILARSIDQEVDLKAIKPKHAEAGARAYSARSLCHKVLVPLSAELGVNIGVSGREPLNNQPYFRMKSLGDGTPVHSRSRPAFEYVLYLVDQLQMLSISQAREALRAYIAVRSKFQTVYSVNNENISISVKNLSKAIATLVNEDSEGGKRAQAAVAGIFDAFAGPDKVESGRINDPSRHYPGDVAIKGDDGSWVKSIEVRDKQVTESDIYIFARICLEKGVHEAAIVLASPKQQRLDEEKISAWAAMNGIGLTLFYGWDVFVDQALFWTHIAKPDATLIAVMQIENRLIAVEASAAAVSRWQTLTRKQNDQSGC